MPYGPVEIPAEPQRIMGDLMSLDYMSALGVDTDRFVGVFDASFFPDDHYLADVVGRDDLVDPGFQFEPNVEQIAAAEPDLIVAPFDQIDGSPALDAMREIAPVLDRAHERDPRPCRPLRRDGVVPGLALDAARLRHGVRHGRRRPRRTSPTPRR